MGSSISIDSLSAPQVTPRPFPALTIKMALAAADVLGFTVALLITARIPGALTGAAPIGVWAVVNRQPMLVYLLLACAGAMWFWLRVRHYSLRRPFWRELREVLEALLVLAVVHLALTTLTKGMFPRGWWALTWSGAFVLVPGFRLLTKRILDLAHLWKRPTLIVGCGESAIEARRVMSGQLYLGADVVAYVAPGAGTHAKAVGNVPVLRGLSAATLRALPGAQVVIALEPDERELRNAWVRALTQSGIREVTVIAPMRGVPLCGTDVSYFFGHELMMLRVQNNLARFSAKALKRGFDLIAGGILMIMLLPVFALLAALVARDGGSAFFGHTRIGRNGRKFKCLKFRSMVLDADKVLAELLERDSAARAEWASDFKLRNDVRVTPIGSLLRKTSLDELPQLWNVLRGEMSLVGPRPVVEQEIERYGEDAAYYLLARPGMTGLWQVSGRNDTDYARRVFLDAWYVRNWSLRGDLAILFKTVGVVLHRDGAY
ncbi:undecaprenyl-phosphate galactose phosphotransferase WbaP [Burkholderia plantarii]|uniref:undecaprenyl-phosphate galactose phosphotransferase WbaP n=1 Tax=Burkholderia plantarii TaxID=41899 RepID=UPI000870B306|nr:undecaprenyl-phosphate galactose phosphotransferase WbaP [Burkholderia plantarii]